MSRLPRVLLAGLVVWGLTLAVGVGWFGANPWKALGVLAGVSIFAGVWLLLLRTRRADEK